MNHCSQNHEPDCDCDSCRGNRSPSNTEHRLCNTVAALTAERDALKAEVKLLGDLLWEATAVGGIGHWRKENDDACPCESRCLRCRISAALRTGNQEK
jgi:hypothetical protein